MADRFDVVEIQIAPPHSERVLTSGISQPEADAFIKTAVMRRGVETHFYTARPWPWPLAQSEDDSRKRGE